MTKFSFDLRVAVFITAISVAPVVSAQVESVQTPEHVVGEQTYPFDTNDPRDEDRPPIDLPDNVAPKLVLLTAEEIEFLESGSARRFAGSVDETVEALEERTPEEVKSWVNAMQDVAEFGRYTEGVDLPNIPFNTESPRFNA